MRADYLIIGQGICGTFLGKYLSDAGKTVIVADDDSMSSKQNLEWRNKSRNRTTNRTYLDDRKADDVC